MTIALFVQLVLNGLMAGGMYALVASGFTLILGVMKVFNFAQGQFYMLGAFVTYAVVAVLGLPYLVAILISVLSMAALGVIMHFGIIKWTLPSGFFHTLVVTVAFGTIVTQASLVTFAGTERVIEPVVAGTAHIGGVSMNYNKLLVICGAIVVMLSLYYFMKTKWGTAMRAAAENRDVAGVLGIKADSIFWITMAVSAGLCGAAGALILPVLSASNVMGTTIFAKAMLVVLVGGTGSISGALIAAFLVGIAESITFQFFGQLNLVVLFGLIAILIFFRPGGLLGKPLPVEERGPQPDEARRPLFAQLHRNVRGTLVLTLLGVLVTVPLVVNGYISQIGIFTITFAMLGLSFALTLRVGLPRFDSAAWWGVGAYTTAMLTLKTDISFWLTVPLAGLVAAVLGYLVFKVAIPRGVMVFLIFGMVISMAIQQLFGSLDFFGRWSGTATTPAPSLWGFELTGKPALYYLGLGLLGVNLLVYHLLYHSKIGRAWTAIGASPHLASSLGIDVVRYRLANVLISNFFLGVAGSYYIAYSRAAVPETFGLAASVSVMMYVIVGGMRNSLAGPIIGALVIAFVPELLRVANQYETIISSGVTILVVVFAPMGLLGLFGRLARPRFSSGSKSSLNSQPAESLGDVGGDLP